MSNGAAAAAAGGGAAAAAAAIANAVKASGTIVRVEREAFLQILARQEAPLVVTAEGGFFNPNYQYLSSYKGLAFFLKTSEPLQLPDGCEVIEAERIWVPS